MSKEKNKKNSTLLIKINKEERDEFIELCKDHDTTASREIRHFIRRWIKENS